MKLENKLGDAVAKELETHNAYLKLASTHEQTKADLEVAQQNIEAAKAYNAKVNKQLQDCLRTLADTKTKLAYTDEQKDVLIKKLQLTETRLRQVQARQNRIEIQDESIKKQKVV